VAETSGGEVPEGSVLDMLALHMGNYFWMAVEARDALIAGNMRHAQVRMQQLADHEFGALVPAALAPNLERVVTEAKQVVAASNLQQASAAMARVAEACGHCHGQLRAGPLANMTPIDEASDSKEDLTARMQRHKWAADALWFGLSRPSDSEWKLGAQALVDAPPQPAAEQFATLSLEQKAAIERVREIGQTALGASTPEARVEAYSDLLQSCAACHGQR